MIDYEKGDTIEYTDFGGFSRRVVVEGREADVKNGKPGFTGRMLGVRRDANVWGYDNQIVRLVSRGAVFR